MRETRTKNLSKQVQGEDIQLSEDDLKGFLCASRQAVSIFSVIHSSDNTEDASARLQKFYDLTAEQSDIILHHTPLSDFTKEKRQEYEAKHACLVKKAKENKKDLSKQWDEIRRCLLDRPVSALPLRELAKTVKLEWGFGSGGRSARNYLKWDWEKLNTQWIEKSKIHTLFKIARTAAEQLPSKNSQKR